MPLLQRSPVMLTLAGERLIPHARAILGAAKAASDAVRDIRTEGRMPLRVGVMAPGSAELTPAVLRAFWQAQPQTRLTVESLGFTDYITPLLEHRVDAAFVRPAPDDERIAAEVLTVEPRVIIAPSPSELADADGLRLADVLDVNYVRLPDPTPRSFVEYAYFMPARNGAQARCGVDQVRTAQDLMSSVAAGQGIGATLYSLSRYYRWPGIRCVPVIDAPWEESVLATRRNDPRPEVQAFRTLAGIIARDLGPKLIPAPELPE
jgi:DNA-binding transcriptional LysR family regulator